MHLKMTTAKLFLHKIDLYFQLKIEFSPDAIQIKIEKEKYCKYKGIYI